MADKTKLNLERIRAYDEDIWRTIVDDAWNPACHPRAKNGQFSKGHGARSGLRANKHDRRTPIVKNNLKLAEGNGKIYKNMERDLRSRGLLNDTEAVMRPVPIKIIDPGKHGRKKMKERGVSLAEAQSYVDNALVMIQQTRDKFCFIAEDGTSVVLEEGRLVTVIKKADYDSEMRQKVSVILSWLRQKKKG